MHFSPEDPSENACADFLSRGPAILTLPGAPLVRLLIGEFRWLSSERALVFPAFGENLGDVRDLRFSEVTEHSFGYCFVKGAEVAALVTTIENARVDDVEDYRVAWSLWREVRPARRRAIETYFASVAASEADATPRRRVAASRPQHAVLGAGL